ncbi:MAG: type II secretion system GspH family protein [Candidatus Moranbacteria bacterium]|jgi:prepilin-type N-terminal cleavage/methylation domain-containing protein|nr:type II secretion system GspH family protein [Candidatus Moranbacteria bacterium]
MQNKKYQKGFTLIELLITIAIIGILSSVILVSLNSSRDKARKANAISMAKSIQTVMEMCMINYTVADDVGNGSFVAGCDPDNGRALCDFVHILNDGVPDAGLPICDNLETQWVWPDFSSTGYEYVNSAFAQTDTQFFYFEIHKPGEATSICCHQKGCNTSTYRADGGTCYSRIIIPHIVPAR